MFPELKPFPLFRFIRVPVIGELLAPHRERYFLERCYAYCAGDTTSRVSQSG
jgi:hypothetical protein